MTAADQTDIDAAVSALLAIVERARRDNVAKREEIKK